MRKLLIAAAASVLAAMPAQAVIVSGALTGGTVVTRGGVFEVTTLSSVAVNTINSKNILGLNERQNFTLTSALRVFNIDVAAGVTPTGTTGSIVLPSGTRVNSHLIILDPTDTTTGPTAGGTTASGTVTFNTPILGFIFAQGAAGARGGANFTASNYLGAPGTTYGALHSTLEGGVDAVSFSGKTLTFAMTSGRDVGDYLRVITGVPEPRSWAMMLAGFGLVGFSLRRRRAAVA